MTPRLNFLARIKVDADGHWIWTGGVSGKYGRFYTAGKRVAAHRFSYTEFVGPIPDGFDVDHMCRVPLCANPAHLRAWHMESNRGDTSRARATHCPNGHPYDAENTLTAKTGRRSCRACRRDRVRKFRSGVAQ